MNEPLVISAGQRFSRVHTLTPAEVLSFAISAGDDNPLHHDAEFASRSRYGGLIASGTHTTALLLGLTASHFSKLATVVGVAFSVTLKRAVPASERITLEWTIDAVGAHDGDRGQRVHLLGRLLDSQGRECVSATGEVIVGLALQMA